MTMPTLTSGDIIFIALIIGCVIYYSIRRYFEYKIIISGKELPEDKE